MEPDLSLLTLWGAVFEENQQNQQRGGTGAGRGWVRQLQTASGHKGLVLEGAVQEGPKKGLPES